jgi:hypothetical protein
MAQRLKEGEQTGDKDFERLTEQIIKQNRALFKLARV